MQSAKRAAPEFLGFSREGVNAGSGITFSDDDLERYRSALLAWGLANKRDFPWRRRIPVWQGLIAEILLQRTRAEQVAPLFEDLVRRFPTARAFSSVSRSELVGLTDRVGLPHRVAQLSALARRLGRTGGALPRSIKGLQELPGIGPYCAAAVTSLHRDRYAVLVDSNVVRVISRLFDLTSNDGTRRSSSFRALADYLTPNDRHRDYNYALLDLGAEICTPRNPRCRECPVSWMCSWLQRRSAEAGR